MRECRHNEEDNDSSLSMVNICVLVAIGILPKTAVDLHKLESSNASSGGSLIVGKPQGAGPRLTYIYVGTQVPTVMYIHTNLVPEHYCQHFHTRKTWRGSCPQKLCGNGVPRACTFACLLLQPKQQNPPLTLPPPQRLP